MIRKSSLPLLILVALLSVASFASQTQSLMTRHMREAVVTGEAQSVGRLPATQTMRFDIVLALRHQPELDNFLQELYDPSSSSYRHFLTPQEFTARFGPSQEEYDAVLGFAGASGFKVVGGSRDGMDVQFEATVASVEKAFHVTMGVYQHPTEKRTFFAPDREPTVDLPFNLWHISGLDNYSLPHAMLKHSNVRVHPNVAGSCPGGYFCGSDMRAAYLGSSSLTGTGQNIALLELAGTDLADLNTYYSNVGQTKPYTPTLISTGGYRTSCLASSGCDDTEQTLDMTQAMGMAPGSKMLYMYVCGDGSGFSRNCLSQRDVNDYSRAVEFANWLFVGLESGGPLHRRPLLQEICDAGPELLRGFWRQRFVPNRVVAFLLPRGGCFCHGGRRHRLNGDQARAAPGVRRPHGLTAAAESPPIPFQFPPGSSLRA